MFVSDRNQTMSLTKASLHFGIPSTTLWQRAHRLGIDTPKKDGPAKSWTEDSLNIALEALRSGTISANKASKAYGICAVINSIILNINFLVCL